MKKFEHLSLDEKYDLLPDAGWKIVCQSPFEIQHFDGSFASGSAADMCIDPIIENFLIEYQEQFEDLHLGMKVYHKEIYHGREQMKIVGIRKEEVELEGDYSGGTHDVIQKEWLPIDGLLFEKTGIYF